MFHGIPIIGIVGGIGSGKSHVARIFGDLGCLVIDSDAQVRQAYGTAEVRHALRQWWGGAVFDASTGEVDRSKIAAGCLPTPANAAGLSSCCTRL